MYNWIKFEHSYIRLDQVAEIYYDESYSDLKYNYGRRWEVGIRLNNGGITVLKSFEDENMAKEYVNTLFNGIIRPVLNYTNVYNAEIQEVNKK